MDVESSKQVLCALVAGSVFKYATSVWMNRNKGHQYVGKVSRLFLYPLKAARELEVGEASITRHGLRGDGVTDRHWMITKEEDGEFQNTKQIPQIILIKASSKDDTLCLDAEGMETLLLPLNPAIQQEWVKTVKVYGNPQEALDCGDKAAAWICNVLQRKGLRLNYCIPSPEGKRLSQTVADTLLPWKPTVNEDDEVGLLFMSRIARKLIFGVSDPVRHIPGCTAPYFHKFWIKEVEELNYLCSENKGADQLALLICAFVFAYTKRRSSHDTAQLLFTL